ncbi:hypothetical protein MPS_5445 [Mycobacterium pseudoshottsii JCM 15466]|nr:hypothetical protein MPS_5445 [Mycobacterium pseudoshottsii JCM 15466]
MVPLVGDGAVHAAVHLRFHHRRQATAGRHRIIGRSAGAHPICDGGQLVWRKHLDHNLLTCAVDPHPRNHRAAGSPGPAAVALPRVCRVHRFRGRQLFGFTGQGRRPFSATTQGHCARLDRRHGQPRICRRPDGRTRCPGHRGPRGSLLGMRNLFGAADHWRHRCGIVHGRRGSPPHRSVVEQPAVDSHRARFVDDLAALHVRVGLVPRLHVRVRPGAAAQLRGSRGNPGACVTARRPNRVHRSPVGLTGKDRRGQAQRSLWRWSRHSHRLLCGDPGRRILGRRQHLRRRGGGARRSGDRLHDGRIHRGLYRAVHRLRSGQGRGVQADSVGVRGTQPRAEPERCPTPPLGTSPVRSPDRVRRFLRRVGRGRDQHGTAAVLRQHRHGNARILDLLRVLYRRGHPDLGALRAADGNRRRCGGPARSTSGIRTQGSGVVD